MGHEPVGVGRDVQGRLMSEIISTILAVIVISWLIARWQLNGRGK